MLKMIDIISFVNLFFFSKVKVGIVFTTTTTRNDRIGI